jgi:hypothetical protein
MTSISKVEDWEQVSNISDIHVSIASSLSHTHDSNTVLSVTPPESNASS